MVIRVILLLMLLHLLRACSDGKYSVSHNESPTDQLERDTLVELKRPELVIRVDRQAIREMNTSTMTVGKEIRTYILANDSISLEMLLDHKIQFRNNKGKICEVPIRAVLDTAYFQ
ncbi:MAG: hypothetical protein ACI865_002920 [Flavobacteriaceae bacterium]